MNIFKKNFELYFSTFYFYFILVGSNFIGAQLGVNNDKKESRIIVETEHGRVEGKNMLSRDGRNIFAFLGVPYAKPPIGPLRFSNTVALNESWEGVIDCTNFKPQCLQNEVDVDTWKFTIDGSEDCLYLNIFTPKKIEELTTTENFPVIFYIHGGIISGNGSQYGPEYFLDEDVILVFVHYRIHAYSYLNTEDGASCGNYGLKDQVLALKWLQANIQNFGGDPKKITIYGNSSGAKLVTTHLLSPMSRGLFHRAISQSGTILYPNTISKNNKKAAYELGKKVGCLNTLSTYELIECLRNVDGKILTEASREINFDVSIEPSFEDGCEERFLEENPLDLLENGLINEVPMIAGVTSSEGLIIASRLVIYEKKDNFSILSQFNGDWNEFLIGILEITHAQDLINIASNLKEFYFSDSKNISKDDFTQVCNVLSDRNFNHPLHLYIMQHLKHYNNSTPVYLYITTKVPEKSYASNLMNKFKAQNISFESPFGRSRFFFWGLEGLAHADDLQYFFPSNYFPRITSGSKYYNFSKYLIRKWVNFANTGNPNNIDDGAINYKSLILEKEPWIAANNNDKKIYYELSENPHMINPFGSRMKIWDSFNSRDIYP